MVITDISKLLLYTSWNFILYKFSTILIPNVHLKDGSSYVLKSTFMYKYQIEIYFISTLIENPNKDTMTS